MFSVFLSTIRFVFVDLILDILYWPVWWYTVGLLGVVRKIGQEIMNTWQALSLGIWIKNLFTPMYADRSFMGRVISFFVRIVLLIWKMIWFVLWGVFAIAFLGLWIAGPFFVIYMITLQY